MKKGLALAVVLFISITACKKQNEATKPLKTKMIGKWQVEKIETKTGNGPTLTTTYNSSNYMDFKENTSDDFELSLGANDRRIGSYSATLDGSFYLDFAERDLQCTVNTINANSFIFKGTVVGANPIVTETYYLKR